MLTSSVTASDPTPVKAVQRRQHRKQTQQKRDEIEAERTRLSKQAYEQMMQAEQEERARIMIQKQAQLKRLFGADSEQEEAAPAQTTDTDGACVRE